MKATITTERQTGTITETIDYDGTMSVANFLPTWMAYCRDNNQQVGRILNVEITDDDGNFVNRAVRVGNRLPLQFPTTRAYMQA